MKKKLCLNYKLLAWIPLILMTGCKKAEHKNIILNPTTVGNIRTILIKDTQSNTERIFKTTYTPGSDFDYLKVGDTVSIKSRFGFPDDYQKRKVLEFEMFRLSYNNDSIENRKARKAYENQVKHFESIKQSMTNSQEL